MLRIGKILVLLVFFGFVTGTVLVPGAAFADPPQPICGDDPEVIDDWGDPIDATDVTGDPDVGGDGLGQSGDVDIIPDDFGDLTGYDPEDPEFWEAWLDYLLSVYDMNF